MLLRGEMEVAGRHRVLDEPVLLGAILVRLDREVRPLSQAQGPLRGGIRAGSGSRHGGTSIVIFARIPGRSCRSRLENSAQTRSWALTGSISGSRKMILPAGLTSPPWGSSTVSRTSAPLEDLAEVLGLEIAFRPQAVDGKMRSTVSPGLTHSPWCRWIWTTMPLIGASMR